LDKKIHIHTCQEYIHFLTRTRFIGKDILMIGLNAGAFKDSGGLI
jgi:hypothetical protein